MASTISLEREAELLIPGVRALLETRIAETTEIVIKAAVAEFEDKLRKTIAISAMQVSSYYDLHRDGANLVITVKTPNTPRMD